MINLSLLDYSPVDENDTHGEALVSTTRMAQRAEELGYKRFWVSEHHGMKTMAGSNPEMLMMHLAAHTHTIRIGSGGVMLQHYSPYKVAESFKLMEALYPNRIDMGTGRAPGGDRITQTALNIGKNQTSSYDQQLRDLQSYITGNAEIKANYSGLLAAPYIETLPEMWSLGAGSNGAVIAANEGTAFVFAHFINPGGMEIQATAHYKAKFSPSVMTEQPKTMVAVFAAIAETEEKAEQLAKAFDHWLLMIESGRETPYYMSTDHIESYRYTESEKETISQNRRRILVGTPKKVKEQIEKLSSQYQTNEVMLLNQIYGKENRLRAIELLALEFGLSALEKRN